MGIIAKGYENDFEVLETGLYRAVCCDVVERRGVMTNYGIKDQILIYWMVDQLMATGKLAGKPFGIVKVYTNSLSKNSHLRKDLESWRGKPFTEEEVLSGFDVEVLIGVDCQINVVAGHKDPENQRFVGSVLPRIKGSERMSIAEGYIRKKDRPTNTDAYGNIKGEGSTPTPQPVAAELQAEDHFDDVPF